MSGNTQRLNSFRATFKPYFPQLGDSERRKLQDLHGPQRVCFAWAVRHQVTQRADERDVHAERASYVGQALAFDENRQLAAPTMTFNSGTNYCNWRDNQSRMVDLEEDVAPEDEREVPDWMLDMESEQQARFG